MQVIEYGNKGEGKTVKRAVVDTGHVMDRVRLIVNAVMERGDCALYDYTGKFDGYILTGDNIRVAQNEIDEAYSRAGRATIMALKHARRNIKKFHMQQLGSIRKSWKTKTDEGIEIKSRAVPIESVGCYVPGGRASYPSTVLMTCIPARVCGVKRIVVVSPPPISDEVLTAAKICGVDEIYRVGGAQAITALAYGTEKIRPVDKIIGPGNAYVTAAKMLVYGTVDIDMPAGPSEVLIIADESANPRFVAADILAQAEHDPNSLCVLATDSRALCKKVESEIEEQRPKLKRSEIIGKALENFRVVLTQDIAHAVDFANDYAPEHLEVMTKNPQGVAGKIRNAGAVFIGHYSPVPAGDYASGGNHVLPTGGAAKFASGLNVTDFLKFTSQQRITREGLKKIRKTVTKLAQKEGLDAHARAVEVRFGK
ncbi:MAG: histidinol dehydrogenase [Candidatus Altiarchaeales archaeon IMC4]|nr:MAG: histidinol dehydrogenase [Candidatus Altiarchaeales archaeon IMC4]